ncbi:hypothetical protein [Aeromonas hydrophila]|uniref:hypothetical protein n=2 Tax=Aeromonadaceae TaxID=84642 RepID=UPI00188DCFBD|nr:hypothetical protein [Aeromonas hydrophila]
MYAFKQKKLQAIDNKKEIKATSEQNQISILIDLKPKQSARARATQGLLLAAQKLDW